MPDEWNDAMLDGAYDCAWAVSDRIMREREGRSCADLPYHQRWVWNGASLAGRTVLVRCYHGLGDTLQFIRFVPRVAAVARAVIIEGQAALLPLLRSVAGAAALFPLDDALPPWEVAIESMELPHALRITLTDLPGPIPYLAPPPRTSTARLRRSRSASNRMRVGIVWAAGDWRRERSIPPELLLRVTRLPLDFVRLQLGPALRDPAARGLMSAFVAGISDDATAVETAALICELDLVVTVDTMVAHLAGALGRPVWTLLDADADWRWMRRRSDSPWYPTMRLFRQAAPHSWESVIDQLAVALTAAARRHGAERDLFLLR